MTKAQRERIEQELNRLQKKSDRFEDKADHAVEIGDEAEAQKWESKMWIEQSKIEGICFCLLSIGYDMKHPTLPNGERDWSKWIVLER